MFSSLVEEAENDLALSIGTLIEAHTCFDNIKRNQILATFGALGVQNGKRGQRESRAASRQSSRSFVPGLVETCVRAAQPRSIHRPGRRVCLGSGDGSGRGRSSKNHAQARTRLRIGGQSIRASIFSRR